MERVITIQIQKILGSMTSFVFQNNDKFVNLKKKILELEFNPDSFRSYFYTKKNFGNYLESYLQTWGV